MSAAAVLRKSSQEKSVNEGIKQEMQGKEPPNDVVVSKVLT